MPPNTWEAVAKDVTYTTIIAGFINGQSIEQLAVGYDLSANTVEEMIREVLTNQDLLLGGGTV